jgi:tetratricopeptide (TPR) repeat protein
MEFTWKKLLLVLGSFIGLIVVPVFLCSSSMMERYQEKIDKEPNTKFHKWLGLATADVCYQTLRPEMAADYYRKFRDTYKDDERRPYACLRYARSLEDCSRNADAIAEYQRYIEEYPERGDTKEALSGIDRIRYVKPIK